MTIKEISRMQREMSDVRGENAPIAILSACVLEVAFQLAALREEIATHAEVVK
ncbi:MAG: hypothetical protein KGL39_19380 [Patescibacteria group bacterium]|nr:hypothetical protein [Patescibacteria group bacterium]